MTLVFYIMISWAVCALIWSLVAAVAVCIAAATHDPMYKRLKIKGKIKYFILQLLEVEF